MSQGQWDHSIDIIFKFMQERSHLFRKFFLAALKSFSLSLFSDKTHYIIDLMPITENKYILIPKETNVRDLILIQINFFLPK